MRRTVCRALWLVIACLLPFANGYAQDSNLAKIKALEEMNAFFRHAAAQQSEESTEHYAGLIHEVAELQDRRAVAALIGAMQTGGMATNGLAVLGDAALDPVISVTHEKDSTRVVSALLTLRKMLEPENLNHFKDQAGAKQKIKGAFERLQNSGNRFIAKDAREGLDLLEGR